tara:strand:- start:252 stop:548 length:297 start_codon:yes stop_codon:yes gene_type:complete
MAFYSKETLFAEFDVAKSKDTKGKYEKYDNRIQFCKDHIELRNNKPEYYEGVDINFSNLLSSWSAENPIDAFYKVGFDKTFAEVKAMNEDLPENKVVN